MFFRLKATRHSFNKIHKFRGNKLGAYVSADIAVFVICPFCEGYKYVVGFTDYATKRSWVYPMKARTETSLTLKDLNFVQLKKFWAEIEHYYADGDKELISNEVRGILKGIGALYSWSRTETPELNGVSGRKFKTVGERCMSIILRAELPTDFWSAAYNTSNYIINRLATDTNLG